MIGSVLLGAFILAFLGLDETLIGAVNEIFNVDYSTNVYWLVAFLVGAIGDIVLFFRRKKGEDVC